MEAVCPICREPVATDDAFIAHLATVHGLVDDAGTHTTLDQAMLAEPERDAPDAPAEGAESESSSESEAAADPDVPVIHPSRIYDPDANNERYRRVSIGLALLLVVGVGALVAGSVDATSSGGSTADQGDKAAPELITASGPRGDGAGAGAGHRSTSLLDATTTTVVVDPAPAPPVAPVPPQPTTAPRVTTPPTTAPPPPTTAPTTAPPVIALTATEAIVITCTKQAGDRTLRFSFVLRGSSRPDGRYEEVRTARVADGPITVRTVRVPDRFGRVVDVTLQPGPVTCG